jgi:hypothetical protein
MINKRTADILAAVVFMLVLLIGLEVVIRDHPSFDPPTTFKKVTEVTRGAGGAKKSRTEERQSQPPGKNLNKMVKRSSKRPVNQQRALKVTRSEEEAARSFGERALGESGLIGLQVILVVVGAFVVAALVQRVAVGKYALKIGSWLDLEAVESNEDIAKDLTAAIEKLKQEHDAALRALSEADKAANVDSSALAKLVEDLKQRLGKIEGSP